MDLEGNGVKIRVNAAEQSDQWLIDVASEIREAAEARNLEVPALGALAVESSQDQDVNIDPSDVKESLFGQLDTAFGGYSAVAEQVNAGRNKKEQFEVADQETVEAEFKTWLTEEKAEYIARALEADPDLRFTVIATPNNVEVTPEEAEVLSREFGKNQPYPIHMWRHILKHHTASELSGTDPNNGNKIRFAAVPSKTTPELYGTVAAQRDALAKLQADMPYLKVSSHLDDLVYWHTLRAGGDDLAHGDVYERTFNRHFDLPQWHGKESYYVDNFVLCSFIARDGDPCVYGSVARDDSYGRVLVG